jgi:hypothetical protein
MGIASVVVSVFFFGEQEATRTRTEISEMKDAQSLEADFMKPS